MQAIYADESIWLTQKMLAQLSCVNVRTVNEHLKTIFADSELQEDSVIRKFRITATDGKNDNSQHHKLPAIIAVGYKVNSERAVHFRKWATGVIEQLQRIRETRLSEHQDTSVAKAKKAIADYKKALGTPAGLAELMVFYCEQASGFASDVGLPDDSDGEALVRMFEQALKVITSLTENQREAMLVSLDSVCDAGHETLATAWVTTWPTRSPRTWGHD